MQCPDVSYCVRTADEHALRVTYDYTFILDGYRPFVQINQRAK